MRYVLGQQERLTKNGENMTKQNWLHKEFQSYFCPSKESGS